MSILIELSNIWKRYGTTEVLKDINLKVNESDFISIRGKSGVGKTTLLKIIGLLEQPDKGEVKLFGKPISNLNDDEKSELRLHHIGFVFQFFNLIPSLTILENIELPLALAGINKQQRKQKAEELLKHFGLMNLTNRFPETLSGGERQRVAIIRALVNNPKIILADEPTSSLDDENSELVIKLLATINKEKKVTIIITTTDLYEKLPTNKNYMLKEGYLHKM
ncbi:MAG: ABC transporter ATP-binding protein [Thermoprotei archaeon]|jgi:putative ABC transport system ATP-binding protein